MSAVLGGCEVYSARVHDFGVILTSVVVLVLLYHCIGSLTLVVSVCVRDGFGSHVDLGGLSVCA